MQGGSADEAAYPHDFEVGCAVCSVPESQGSVYPRWGHRECPDGTTTLYSGFMSSSYYGHSGGGANTLCMHPQGQLPVHDPDGTAYALTLRAKSNTNLCADIHHGNGDNLYLHGCHTGDNRIPLWRSHPGPADNRFIGYSRVRAPSPT